MNINIFNFVENIMNVLASWLSLDRNEWAWCPIKVDNRIDRF